ncbi:uncharacterized protein LOC132167415 [Corylus avellana]|uniref:uncharacterized protein LOC132167415 n=1 Tax=Corylus avellana TaxID=13451 RepID=UPI00286C5724|nr:uncharacterized protein LOC132167415 [Corylus avellana]
MDVVGVNHVSSKKQPKRITKKPIKVVYISTPMKVKTSASKFRDLVQELTGQDSDTTRYVEINGTDDNGDANCRHDFPDQQFRTMFDEASGFPLSNSYCNLLQPYSESSFNPSQNMLRSFDLM